MDRERGPGEFDLVDLGPGLLRRPPKNWLPARAMPVEFKVTGDYYHSADSGDGLWDDKTSTRLRVRWEIHIPGRQTYGFYEVRKSPTWAMANDGLGGAGNRWYKIRGRKTYGLLAALGVPCYVNPQNGHELWVDWDAAFEEHIPEWDRRSAVEREVARRRNPLERVMNRVTDPLAGKLAAEDQHLADAQIAREDAELAAQEAKSRAMDDAMMIERGFLPDEKARYDELLAESMRIYETGREVDATVASCTDTGRTLYNLPIYAFALDVQDAGGVRRVALEYPIEPRVAKRRYKQGKRIKVRIDAADPGKLTLA